MTSPDFAPFQQNQVPTKPTLSDLLDLWKKAILLGLNCHAIGTIQSFNDQNQTATATVNYKKLFFNAVGVSDQAPVQYTPELIDYPVLVDCPAIVLGGGGGSLTFPIGPGDECLILFNDRDLNNWFGGSSSSTAATPRLHSFSDGLILVGLRSLANVLTNYDAVRAVLRLGDAMVGVGAGGGTLVKIANATLTLNGVLQELATELQNLTTAIALITVSGVTSGSSVSAIPVNAAAITAIGTQIGVTAAKIGGLLE